ncbi:MAG: YCF48-related protein [Chitinophagaceae bacterium]
MWQRVLQIFLIGVLFSCKINAQLPLIQLLDSSQNTSSFRGISVVNEEICWISGSKGTVGYTIDGGKNFTWLKVKGYENRDFRDVEAFDNQTAIIMAVDAPALILKTTDAGKNWRTVLFDTTKGMFLDALFFKGKKGWVIGDPINQRPYLACTTNSGDSWLPYMYKDTLQEGEAFFASSGSNIAFTNFKSPLFVSGGKSSRLLSFVNQQVLPIIQGTNSTGANSISIYNKKTLCIVGGDFAQPNQENTNCLLSINGGKTWQKPQTPPIGYKSAVIYCSKQKLVACGTTGVDISTDCGNNWQKISTLGFHTLQKSPNGKTIFLAGGRGKIAKLVWPKKLRSI